MRAFVALLLATALAGGCQPRYVYNDPDDRMYGPTAEELDDLHHLQQAMFEDELCEVVGPLLGSVLRASYELLNASWTGHHREYASMASAVHHMHRVNAIEHESRVEGQSRSGSSHHSKSSRKR